MLDFWVQHEQMTHGERREELPGVPGGNNARAGFARLGHARRDGGGKLAVGEADTRPQQRWHCRDDCLFQCGNVPIHRVQAAHIEEEITVFSGLDGRTDALEVRENSFEH